MEDEDELLLPYAKGPRGQRYRGCRKRRNAPREGHLAAKGSIGDVGLDHCRAPVEEERKTQSCDPPSFRLMICTSGVSAAQPTKTEPKRTLLDVRAHQKQQFKAPVPEPLPPNLDHLRRRPKHLSSRLPIEIKVESRLLRGGRRAAHVRERVAREAGAVAGGEREIGRAHV